MIADVGGALGSQYLTESIGWEGMIYTTGFFAFLGKKEKIIEVDKVFDCK